MNQQSHLFDEDKPKVKNIQIIDGPQADFLNLPYDVTDCLFGGSAGGSKSYSIVLDNFINAEKYAIHWNSLIVRKTYPQLDDIFVKCNEVFGDRARWNEQKKMYTFHNGARVKLGHMQGKRDHLNYQGHSYSGIYVDEVTHWDTPEQIDFVRSRLRSTHAEMKPYFRSTTNPGGPGHQWVSERYRVEDYPQGYVLFEVKGDDIPEEYKSKIKKTSKDYRTYIPARLKDNPHLMQNDNYINTLLSLPDKTLVKALLEGDWSVLAGTFFDEMRPNLHIVDDFEIPHDWERGFGYDYGYTFPAGVYVAFDPKDKIFYIYDYYLDSKVTIEDQGRAIKQKHLENQMFPEDDEANYADPTIFQGEPPTVYDRILMNINFQRGINNRIYGWNLIRTLLKPSEKDPPRLKILKKAKYVYDCLKNVPRSDKNPDDVDTNSNLDHHLDALRYLLVTKWFLPNSGRIEEMGLKSWEY